MPVVKHIFEDPELKKDINKNQAFRYAVSGEHSDIMHFLFTKVGRTEIPSYLSIGDSDGSMPFHLACGSGNLDAVESFTEAVISSSDPLLLANTNNNGYNVFHFAATNISLPIIEHLIEVIPVLSAIVPINIMSLAY